MKLIFFIIFLLFYNFGVVAAGGGKEIPKHKWSFNGLTGTFDKSAISENIIFPSESLTSKLNLLPFLK